VVQGAGAGAGADQQVTQLIGCFVMIVKQAFLVAHVPKIQN
jgi:hypothetical protein